MYNEQLISYLNQIYPETLSIEDIKEYFSINTADELATLYKDINECESMGDILTTKRGNYMLPLGAGLYKGTLRGNSKGFAFVICKDSQDIFIPPRHMSNAYDGDTVYVKLLPSSRGDSSEGEVVKVLSRGRTQIVGTYVSNAKFGFVLPDDKRFFKDIHISKPNRNGAQNGDKVVCDITSYGSNQSKPEGKISEILGKSGEKGIDVLSIIKNHNLRTEFPIEAIQEAQRISLDVNPSDLENRQDFTGDLVITIDGEDARDLDDAVTAVKNQDGTFTLTVHIADVSHYVKEKTSINQEALKRGTSVYFPDRVLPMLPKELSNGICSLNENVTRLTLSVIMKIDRNGKVIEQKIAKGYIKTIYRMTYTSVTKIIEGDALERKKYPAVLDMINVMGQLAEILSTKRTKRGSIDFDVPECKILLDSTGKVSDIVPYERTLSHKIIEEFMIVTNETVAEFMENLELPFIYRVHEKPSEEKMYGFKQLLKALSLKIKIRGEIHSTVLLEILNEVRDLPIFPVVNKVMLRSMQKAKYTPRNIGHFGLGSKCYSHFTSPIRRYPDLMIHRIISYMLSGKLNEDKISKIDGQVYDISDRCSECERTAEEAERDADNLKKAEFMLDKVGNSYDGVISGVINFGIFVELKNTVEGIIKIDKLPKDVYNYMENTFSLVGSKHSYRLGDSVRIKVSNVEMSNMRVEFVLDESYSIK